MILLGSQLTDEMKKIESKTCFNNEERKIVIMTILPGLIFFFIRREKQELSFGV